MTVESASTKQATSRQVAASNVGSTSSSPSSKSPQQVTSKLPLASVKRQRTTSTTAKSNTKSPVNNTSKQPETTTTTTTTTNDTTATIVLTTTASSEEATNKNDAQEQQSQSAKNLQLLAEEAQDLKTKSRKLLLEIDEKNEIINVLKDELETLREQSDKFQRENIQLVKDAKRVKFLQDENDFLQDKVGQVDKLELEIKRLKEKLNETEFFKLRIKELEEDLGKSQEESQEFEDKWRQAESKLTRVGGLEQELNKWKSFSHELEQEKNSIQAKLLESIDQEAKLDSVNKKVEDEVRRLRDLIKSYEEQRDEEQASNSLMSVADLKQFDQQEQEEANSKLEELTKSHKQIKDELEANKELISELRQDLACEKSLTQRLTSQLTSFTKQIKSLDRQYFPIHDTSNGSSKATPMVINNKQKQQLSEQKQTDDQSTPADNVERKHEDQRQHEATKLAVVTSNTLPTPTQTEQDKVPKSCAPHATAASCEQPPASTNINISNKSPAADHTTNELKESLQQKRLPTAADGSHQQRDQLFKRIVTTKPSAKSASSPSPDSRSSSTNKSKMNNDSSRHDTNQRQSVPASTVNDNHIAEDNDDDNSSESSDAESFGGSRKGSSKLIRASTPIKSQQRSDSRSNFVRNSLPSRSVNFGHAKSSAYLDKIRASVTATTTSNSSTCSTSKTAFNEQITMNPSLSSQQQQHQQQVFSVGSNSNFKLNCMLDHQHSDRCFASVDRPTNVQASQPPTLPSVLFGGPGLHPHQQQHLASHHNLNNQHHNAPGSVSSSRQLNALIDPVTQEQLLVCMLQQQMAAQQPQPSQQQQAANGLPNVPRLTEQQVAHLSNLHRQHYYHHLHQLHQMHHLHHLHHKCQQQSQTQHRPQPQPQPKTEPSVVAAVNADIYGGKSQFYAPRYDQIYANMAVNNDINKLKEQQQQKTIRQHNGTKLVNKDQHNEAMSANEQPQSNYSRVSPQRITSTGSSAAPSQAFHHQPSGPRLAQIDELTNGLPIVNHGIKNTTMPTVNSHRQLSPNGTATGRTYVSGTTANQQEQQHRSPASSSPTSSRTSSNISPSSDASSSSTTSSNSLSTSVPLTRSALRHTTTEPPSNRRQYSVERDLINSQPMTATLSRVGSCRGIPQRNQLIDHQQQQQQMMRNPLQSQQPPMRTSKILNIGHQQSGNMSASASSTTNHYQQAGTQMDPKMAPTAGGVNNANGINRLTSNLANIKLNDNLAFSSLRAPKKSSSGSDLNTTLMAAVNGRSMNCKHAAAHGNGGGARISSTSSSPDKARILKTATTTTSSKSKNDVGNNNGKSPVWFEYGCI